MICFYTAINIVGFISGFVGGVAEDELNLTLRQKVFLIILLPCMLLGYLCGIGIVKFFKWLAGDKEDIVKHTKDNYYDYCLKCKHLKYLNNFDITNERTCVTLDIVFNKGECPCNSKLFEKES